MDYCFLCNKKEGCELNVLCVSILVLMDYCFLFINKFRDKDRLIGFNPCFNGLLFLIGYS